VLLYFEETFTRPSHDHSSMNSFKSVSVSQSKQTENLPRCVHQKQIRRDSNTDEVNSHCKLFSQR